MAQIPCKSCGGLNDIPPNGALTGECQYCGALVTFPKLSGSEAERLFNKAEEFRKVFHFDRAIDLYKELIKSDPDEPEYYWGLALSSYGIEYVEEKGTGRRVPTCHRLHYAPLTSDPDYLEALKRSDPARRGIYEAEGKRIAEIQSRILAVAGENKYDVFICFKQTDDDGNKTQDCADAYKVYDLLTKEGYRVFFSYITLKDKAGVDYEPYIFTALNSAKIMLLFGSQRKFLEAQWVKNEWLRYLELMDRDDGVRRWLIPCYRGDPWEVLPGKLPCKQGFEVGVPGWEDDVTRRVSTLLPPKRENPVLQSAGGDGRGKNASLIILACREMRRNEPQQAKRYCDQSLENDANNGWAYLLKLLIAYDIALDKYKDLSWILYIVDTDEFRWAEEAADASGDTELKDTLAELKRLYAENLPTMLERKAAREKAERDRQAQLEREEAERRARLERERAEKEAQRKKELYEQRLREERERRKEQFLNIAKWVGYFSIPAVIAGAAIFVHREILGIAVMVMVILSLVKPFLFGTIMVAFGILFALGCNVTGLESAPIVRLLIGVIMIILGIRSSKENEDSKISMDSIFPFLLFAALGSYAFIGASNWIVKGVLATVLLIVAGFALA